MSPYGAGAPCTTGCWLMTSIGTVKVSVGDGLGADVPASSLPTPASLPASPASALPSFTLASLVVASPTAAASLAAASLVPASSPRGAPASMTPFTIPPRPELPPSPDGAKHS